MDSELDNLQLVAREKKNTFEVLMEAAKDYSLGSMSHAFHDVGGEYRRICNRYPGYPLLPFNQTELVFPLGQIHFDHFVVS